MKYKILSISFLNLVLVLSCKNQKRLDHENTVLQKVSGTKNNNEISVSKPILVEKKKKTKEKEPQKKDTKLEEIKHNNNDSEKIKKTNSPKNENSSKIIDNTKNDTQNSNKKTDTNNINSVLPKKHTHKKCNVVVELNKLKLDDIQIIYGNKGSIVQKEIESIENKQEKDIVESTIKNNTLLHEIEKEGDLKKFNETELKVKDAGIDPLSITISIIGTYVILKGLKYLKKKKDKKDEHERKMQEKALEIKANSLNIQKQQTTQNNNLNTNNIGNNNMSNNNMPLNNNTNNPYQNTQPSAPYRQSGNNNENVLDSLKQPINNDIVKLKNAFIKNKLGGHNFIKVMQHIDDSKGDKILFDKEDNIKKINGDEYISISNLPSIGVYHIDDIKCMNLIMSTILSKYGKLNIKSLQDQQDIGKLPKDTEEQLNEEQKLKLLFEHLKQENFDDTIKRIEDNTKNEKEVNTYSKILTHISKYKPIENINAANLVRYGKWLAGLKCEKDKYVIETMNVFGEILTSICLQRSLFEIKNILDVLEERNTQISKLHLKKQQNKIKENINEVTEIKKSIDQLTISLNNLEKNYQESFNFLKNHKIIDLYNKRRNSVKYEIDNDTENNPVTIPSINENLTFNSEDKKFIDYNNDIKSINVMCKKVKTYSTNKDSVGKIFNSKNLRLALKILTNIDISTLDN